MRAGTLGLLLTVFASRNSLTALKTKKKTSPRGKFCGRNKLFGRNEQQQVGMCDPWPPRRWICCGRSKQSVQLQTLFCWQANCCFRENKVNNEATTVPRGHQVPLKDSMDQQTVLERQVCFISALMSHKLMHDGDHTWLLLILCLTQHICCCCPTCKQACYFS